jgi:hypothetical protein
MAKLLEDVAYRKNSPALLQENTCTCTRKCVLQPSIRTTLFHSTPQSISRRRLPSRPITTRHLVLRLSLSKLLPSLIAEPSHLSVFDTQTLGVVRRPANMSFVKDIRPLRVMFLLFAFGCHCVHEILLVRERICTSAKPPLGCSSFACLSRGGALARLTSEYSYDANKHTQVALNVLNLNCRSSPLPLSHNFHRPESTSAVVSFVSSSVFSPREGEMSLAETIVDTVL